jgi:chromosome segregation ATPase
VSDQQSLSFDRMRSMLMRAAEIRDSEQQQIFDSLDEIHARLAALDALGSMRKRLAELPDRTEVSVLAERLDETVAKLDAQESSVAAVGRAVEALVDRLAKPFAQLDGRLDGMAGRMEGVVGKMDGLDDKLGGLHKRLDDLDNRLDRHELRLDGMPGAISAPVKERLSGVESTLRGKIDEVDDAVRHQLEATREESRRTVEQAGETLRQLIGDTSNGLHGKLAELAQRPAVDPTDQLTALGTRLDALTDRLNDVTKRLDELDRGLGTRPDRDSLVTLVRQANQESERRHAGQLDEAMATFAELILGRGPQVPQMPMPAPRPAQRRTRPKAAVKTRNGTTPDEPSDDTED